jgi:hypothetical protein
MRLLIGIRASTVSAYSEARRDLFGAFDLPRTGLATMEFETEEGLELQCDVQLAGAIQATLLPGEVTLGEVWVPLISPSSIFETQELFENNITFASGEGIVDNTGDSPLFPEVRVFGQLTSATDIVLENNTTGRELSFTGLSLGALEYFNIDMEAETVTKNDLQNLYSYVDEHYFWWLDKGENTIKISGTTGASGERKASVRYRLGYIGV